MNIKEAYTKWSASYDADKNLTRDLDQEITRKAFGHLHFGTILEIGCGTGKNTSLFTKVGERTCALDFSSGMLKIAKSKFKSNRVVFALADLTNRWPCKNNSVDLVSCNLLLEHIPDLLPIFVEAHRVLAEKGTFFISELHPFRQYQGTQANFQRNGKVIEIPAFVHHISGFTQAAAQSGFSLRSLNEWWHEDARDELPRLVSFQFVKRDS